MTFAHTRDTAIRASLPNIRPSSNTARKILLGVGYVAFFLFTFVLFAYWTFPYGRLKDWMIQRVEYPPGPDGRRQPSGYQLEIMDLDPYWLSGVELTGVRLVKLPEGPDEQPVDVRFDEVTARASILSLLVGDLDVSFDTKVAGGHIEGELAQSEQRTALESRIRGVELGQLGPLRRYVGLPIFGTVGGDIDLTVAEKIKNTGGSLSLDVEKLRIGDGNAKLKLEGMDDGLTVDQMKAGDLSVRIDVEEGVARVNELQSDGKHLELAGSGTIRLLKPLKMSRLDLLFRVNFKKAYRNKSDRTRALFSLMDFNSRLRKARTSDGALQWRLNGSFGARIRTQPAKNASPPGKGR